MNNIITGGFARALNKLAAGRLDGDYIFAVPQIYLSQFLFLLSKSLKGEFIESKPGETYNLLDGTDASICLSSPEETDILIPVHKNTMEYWVEKSKYIISPK